ncbi:MAG: ATP-binding protein [Burkholderiales bacterium]
MTMHIRDFGNKTFTKALTVAVTPQINPESIWIDAIQPLLSGFNDNVVALYHYALNQVLNNVARHSAADEVKVEIDSTANRLRITVSDNGVGIFEKIRDDLGLPDVRNAVMELAGRRPANMKSGLFVTSRMFDEFVIQSQRLLFSRLSGDDWQLVETGAEHPGTLLAMVIHPRSPQTVDEILTQCSRAKSVNGVVRAQVAVKNAVISQQGVQYEHSRAGGKLSRSAGEILESAQDAEQLLSSFACFNEIFLDFSEVQDISPEFAAEIFREFRGRNPQINLLWGHANPEVEQAIQEAVT